MTVWFESTITAYNKDNTAHQATTPDDKLHLERIFVFTSKALFHNGKQRFYFADRVPDVSGDVLATKFKAWLDAKLAAGSYIYKPSPKVVAQNPPPAPAPAVVVHVHRAPSPPPVVDHLVVYGDPDHAAPPPPLSVDEIHRQAAREHEARQRELLDEIRAERDRATREAERAQRELRDAQEDHVNAMRAELQRLRDQQAAERLELQRMRVETHQHFVQNNMFMQRPPPMGRGAPPPRIRRPPTPSFSERLALGLAQAVQVAGQLLVGDGNAGLNERQRALLRLHNGNPPRRN